MSLTDERINELAEDCAGPFTQSEFVKIFARAIEAEATKPLVTDTELEDFSGTKPQEPVVLNDLQILRRIAERGLKLAQRENVQFIDIFQHTLDEIQRCTTPHSFTCICDDCCKTKPQEPHPFSCICNECCTVENAPQPQEPVAWNDGYPTNPRDTEWFIAKLKGGSRVVLRKLPEEYTYDFTTADETYYKKEVVKQWMQFPESEFITPQPCPSCAEKQSAIDVWEGRYADLTAKCAELEAMNMGLANRLNEELSGSTFMGEPVIEPNRSFETTEYSDLRKQVAELEASRPICSTCACEIDKAAGVDVAKLNNRIKELEAERDALKAEYEERINWLIGERDALKRKVKFEQEHAHEHYDASKTWQAKCDALAMQNQQMRTVLEDAAQDYRSVAHYDEIAYQHLRGSYEEVDEALALPDHTSIIKRHDADKKDAERYRWLREQHWHDSNICVVMHPKNAVKLGHQCPSDDRLDAAIDSELEKS